ncbi:MAG: hypothetical protein DELT_01434 [Desulfovibrio sp.]
MRASYKKALKITARVFGGLFLLVFVALAGTLIWLRTGFGERTVAGIVTDALAEQGLTLKTESFGGPLPSRLHLTGISLADADGEWFRAKELDVRLDLLALLGKTAAVSLARVDTPEIYRLPNLPASGEPAATTEPAPKEPVFFTLPIGIRLDDLVLENIGVYAPLAFPDATFVPGKPLLQATVTGKAAADAGKPLNAVIDLDARVADMAQLAANAGELPVDAFALRAALKADVGDAIIADLSGTATPGKNGETYPLDYGVQATLQGDQLTVPKIAIDGLALHLASSAEYNLANGAAKITAKFLTDDGGRWESLVAALTGQKIGGGVVLTADAAMNGDGAFTARTDVAGTGMRWGAEDLQKILGSALILKAEGAGGNGAPYSLNLEKLSAGIIGASGTAAFDQAANTAKASLNAVVSDISPLVPGAAGSLTAKADVSGALDAPVFALDVASDSLEHTGAAFGGINATVRGKALLKAEKTVEGTATAALEKSPAGPVTFSTGMNARQDATGTLFAHLSDLALKLAGTDVAADIEAVVPAASSGKQAALTLKGRTAVRILDWRPLAALTNVPISGGKAGFQATFTHDGQEQTVTADIQAESLAMPDAFSITGLNGTLEARNLAKPDITLNLGMGKSEAGPVDWESGAVSLHAKEGAGSFAVALRTDKTAKTALQSLMTSPKASKPGKGERLSVGGKFSLDPMTFELDRLAARLPDSPLGVYLASPASVALGAATEVKGLKLNVVPGNGTVECDATFSQAAADAAVTIRDFPFRLIRELSGAPIPDGTANATVALTKKGASVTGKVDAEAVMMPPPSSDPKLSPTPPVVFTLASTLDRAADPNFPELRSGAGMARLRGDATLGFGSGGFGSGNSVTQAGQTPNAVIAFNFPLRFSAEGIPAPAEDAPLAATVSWRGDVAPLWALAPMPDRTLTGTAQLDASLQGTLANPSYTASAYMAGGQFEDNILGILLTKIALEATSASGQDSRLVLRAEDTQNGFVALEGTFNPGTGETEPTISARGHIDRLEPLQRDDLFLRLSGRIAVNGPVSTAKVNAAIEVERGELSLLTTLGGGVRTLDITEAGTEAKRADSGPSCDITVSIPHRFYIRGRGLDSEWRGNLAVSGPLSAPELTGSLQPVRGTFDLLSRPFAFDKGDISFFGGDRINPGLNLSLTYEGPNLTAIIRATGSAKKPEIKLESQPSLPQDQILAEVLFGKEFSRLSRFEALQVANSVRQLANIGGGIDPLTSMRTTLGIDMLRVGSSGADASDNRSVSGAPGADAMGGGKSASSGDDTASTPTVEAGKYINDAIYVGVEQGTTADSTGVRVEVELRPNLTLQGKTTTRSSQVGLGWKRDY